MYNSYDWYLYRYIAERWCFKENLFTEDECNNIITVCKDYDNLNFAEVEKNNKAVVDTDRKSKVLFLPSTDDSLSWIFERIANCVTQLNKQFFDFDIHKIEALQFSEYSSEYNGYFKKHVDFMYNSPNFRKLSFTIQLSDENSYTGGDLLFHLSDEPQYAKRTRGTITLFPSFLLHEVTPVTDSVRYCLVGWMSGPPFK